MNPKSSTSREFVERLDLIDAQSPQDASDVRGHSKNSGWLPTNW